MENILNLICADADYSYTPLNIVLDVVMKSKQNLYKLYMQYPLVRNGEKSAWNAGHISELDMGILNKAQCEKAFRLIHTAYIPITELPDMRKIRTFYFFISTFKFLMQ